MTTLKNVSKPFVALSVLVFLTLLVSCSNSVAIPTETSIPTVSPTATITPSPAPTSPPTITPSPTLPPTATIDPSWSAFDSEWLQLRYPQDWNVEKPLGEPDCAPGAIDCIIRLSHSPSESVEIRLTRMPLFGASSDVVQADEDDWNMRKISAATVGAANLLKPISVDEMEVDGIKAVKRLYEYPLVDWVTGKVKDTQYNYRVLIIDGDHAYWFEMQTTSADEFEKYTGIADNMVATIAFHK
jgi:hypothetical protein